MKVNLKWENKGRNNIVHYLTISTNKRFLLQRSKLKIYIGWKNLPEHDILRILVDNFLRNSILYGFMCLSVKMMLKLIIFYCTTYFENVTCDNSIYLFH